MFVTGQSPESHFGIPHKIIDAFDVAFFNGFDRETNPPDVLLHEQAISGGFAMVEKTRGYLPDLSAPMGSNGIRERKTAVFQGRSYFNGLT